MEAKKQAGRSPAAFFAEARGAAAQRAPQTKKQLRRRRKVFFTEG